MEDGTASIECAAFEPTKGFRSIIRQLRAGDKIIVYGSVKEGTLNLEKIKLTALNQNELRNPLCCGKHMKSMGRGQGFRCEKCGAKSKEQAIEPIKRNISTGFYEVPPSARRHLSKPLVRFQEKSEAVSCAH